MIPQCQPEHVEAHAAQGYSPADVKKLLGADVDSSGPLKDAYRRGSQRWRENGKMTPPPADAVIWYAVQSQLKSLKPGESSHSDKLMETCPYQHADILIALETLFDRGWVELHTVEHSDTVEVVVTDKFGQEPAPASSHSGGAVRKTLMSQDVENLFAEGLSVPQVCKRLGISSATFYKRREPEILVAIERGRARAAEAGRRVVREPKMQHVGSLPAPANDTSLIATRDQLFSRMKELTAEKEAIEREMASTQEAHAAIVNLLRLRK